jgi:hypothetical protein
MTMKLLLIGSAALLALSGCSKSNEIPRGGKYSPSVKLTSIDFPGMTPEIKAQAQQQFQTQFASVAGGERCVKSGAGSDWKEMTNGMSKGLGGECKTLKDNSTPTVADMEMMCKTPAAGDINISMKGKAEAESFSVDMVMKFDNPAAGGKGSLAMNMSAKRTGDCD